MMDRRQFLLGALGGAGALALALAPEATVLEPHAGGGDPFEELALVQADKELAAAGLRRRRVSPWESVAAGPFTLTALPACDGTGDPQVAWLVEADGVRVLHLGDTMFHGFWWRMARRHGPFDVVLAPVNGAVVGFPHRTPPSPFPVVLDPAQAAIATDILGARLAIPIHADGYEVEGVYRPVPDAAERFATAALERGVSVGALALGESIEITGERCAVQSSAPGSSVPQSDLSASVEGQPSAARRDTFAYSAQKEDVNRSCDGLE